MSLTEEYLLRMERLIEQHSQEGKSVWELLKTLDPHLKSFIDSVNKLYDEGKIKIENGKIRSVAKLKAAEYRLDECEECDYYGLKLSGKWQDVLKEFEELSKDRPQPDSAYFQGYMIPKDTVKRAAYMNSWADLEGKSVFILGDDDLLSLALALTNLPSSITVLDIDKRVVDYINNKAKNMSVKLEAYEYNVKEPLPETFIEKYDVFSSEPLETYSGLRAFLLRGTLALKKGGSAYVGLSRSEANPKKWIYFQKTILKFGYYITDIRLKFSRYKVDYPTANYEMLSNYFKFPVEENNGIIWYTSALYRLELVKKQKLSNKRINVRFVDPYDDVSFPKKQNNK